MVMLQPMVIPTSLTNLSSQPPVNQVEQQDGLYLNFDQLKQVEPVRAHLGELLFAPVEP